MSESLQAAQEKLQAKYAELCAVEKELAQRYRTEERYCDLVAVGVIRLELRRMEEDMTRISDTIRRNTVGNWLGNRDRYGQPYPANTVQTEPGLHGQGRLL